MEKKRNIKMDNLKGILIILVVVGHILELCISKGNNRYWYFLIYSFHMPLFVYCTGYFANVNKVADRVIKKLFPLYVVFQILYILFERVVLKNDLEMQFSKPYWLLWYLFAVVIWNLLLPLVTTRSRKKQVVVMVTIVFVALLAGFDNGIGRSMSLSRVLVYFPFFVMGYYLRMWDEERAQISLPEQESVHERRTKKLNKLAVKYRLIISIAAILAIAGVAIVTGSHLKEWKLSWFYEAAPYERTGSDFDFRLFHLATGTLGVIAARRFIPNRRIPIIDKIGQKTMPIYLTHGFVVKWIDMLKLLS